MKPKEISSKTEFDTVIQHGISLIDFNAHWCGPCRMQGPILEKIGDAFNGKAVIACVNIDNHQDIAVSFGIQSIPTLIIFKNQKEVKRLVGLQPESTLISILTEFVE